MADFRGSTLEELAAAYPGATVRRVPMGESGFEWGLSWRERNRRKAASARMKARQNLESTNRQRANKTRQMFADMVAEGMTIAEIAARLDRTRTSVTDSLRRYGLQAKKVPRPSTVRARERERQITELYKAGYRRIDAARRLGWTDAAVGKISRRLRLNWRKKAGER